LIEITDQIAIDEASLHYQYVQAAGPGGQNVNKVATAVQLRLDIDAVALPVDVRDRLVTIAGRKINQAGELVIQAARYRTQEQNRADALQRLVELLRRAARPPRPRRATRPTLAFRQKRLEQKHRRGVVKSLRRERFPKD
jgi:ribosome-associated protein